MLLMVDLIVNDISSKAYKIAFSEFPGLHDNDKYALKRETFNKSSCSGPTSPAFT